MSETNATGDTTADDVVFDAGTIARDTVEDERVIVLECTAVPASDYFLIATQRTVAQSRQNRREWADDPVVEAIL